MEKLKYWRLPWIEGVAFADEAAKFVAENQQEVDFSAERPDGAFCVSDKLQQQIAANQDRNPQQSELFSVSLVIRDSYPRQLSPTISNTSPGSVPVASSVPHGNSNT